jgi:DNA-binding MarR family transcriptional regulator
MTDPSAPEAIPAIDAAMTARLRLAITRLNRQMVRTSYGQDLTFGQLSALFRIEQFGPLRLSELAGRERVAAPSMIRIIASLTERRLVGKAPDPQDGRSFLIAITASGARVIADTRRERSQVMADRVDRLTFEQAEALYAALPVLEALADHLDDGRTVTRPDRAAQRRASRRPPAPGWKTGS